MHWIIEPLKGFGEGCRGHEAIPAAALFGMRPGKFQPRGDVPGARLRVRVGFAHGLGKAGETVQRVLGKKE
jgi:hypothetical protein